MNHMEFEQQRTAVHKTIKVADRYGKHVTREWLEEAISLDGAVIGAAPEIMKIIDDLFPQIEQEIIKAKRARSIKAKNGRARLKYACKTILFNLYIGYLLGVPVRYSRRKGYYISNKRYGKLHFKYNRIIPAIDAFRAIGLIETKAGSYNRKNEIKRQSRMWASGELVRLFKCYAADPLPVYRGDREEYIELRNKKKHPLDYEDDADTITMREHLNRYNDFISGQKVEVTVDGALEVNLQDLMSLARSLLKSEATLDNVKVRNNNTSSQGTNTTGKVQSSTNINVNTSTNSTQQSVSITGSFFNTGIDSSGDMMGVAYKPEDWFFLKAGGAVGSNGMDDTVSNSNISLLLSSHHSTKHTEPTTPLNHLAWFIAMVKREYKKNKYSIKKLRERKPLSEFGIDQLNMTLNTNKLYRVFNNESFKQGGRFYGAPYQKMSEKVRSGILINGEPTVELDYSAHHIRLPYHLKGIDYRDDPYLALADSKEERDRAKTLLLVAMNAKSEAKAIKGFRGRMKYKVQKGSGILTDKNIKRMLQKVRKVHHPIEDKIHSGDGIFLQNKDSKITDAILLRMTKMGVPCLAVHDSYIVPQSYNKQLHAAMVGEYKRVTNFAPMIK